MIIDKTTKVKITKKNINHYKCFFNNINLKDIIEVDIETQLQKNSQIKFDVKCDICDTERYINFQSYNKNINSCKNHPIYTCDKCSHIKLKDYNLNNYGVEYYSQHPDRNEKVKKTMNSRYGVDHFSKTELFKEKVSKTNLEKFGYTNPFIDKERIKSIFNEKYGVDHPSQVPEFNDKIKQTNLEKFGYTSPLKSPEVREKINETNKIKYDGHYTGNKEYRYLNTIIGRDKDYISYEGNNISLFKCDLKEHNFKITSELYHNRLRSNLPLCTICYPLNENKSIKELELLKFIESIYNNKIIKNYRDSLEIDIYLPDLKIGFEFNGLYWHSEKYKSKNYHLIKTDYFKERGIRIIHIWEDDWISKSDIIKSQISNLLHINIFKIFARNCIIKEVNTKICKDFLNKNHIQGQVNSVIKLGLYHNEELISIMTFDHFEGRNRMSNNEWNLSRFCNLLNTTVIGGASKLLKYFIKKYNPKRIISYADKDWSVGDLYYKTGFKLLSDLKPDYKYIVDNVRVHKSRYRKSRLNTNLSESQFMNNLSIYKIFDCGKLKFELILPC